MDAARNESDLLNDLRRSLDEQPAEGSASIVISIGNVIGQQVVIQESAAAQAVDSLTKAISALHSLDKDVLKEAAEAVADLLHRAK